MWELSYQAKYTFLLSLSKIHTAYCTYSITEAWHRGMGTLPDLLTLLCGKIPVTSRFSSWRLCDVTRTKIIHTGRALLCLVWFKGDQLIPDVSGLRHGKGGIVWLITSSNGKIKSTRNKIIACLSGLKHLQQHRAGSAWKTKWRGDGLLLYSVAKVRTWAIFIFIKTPSDSSKSCLLISRLIIALYQSGRSPKVVAFFSATNFSSNIIELLQLHDTIQI